MTPSQRLRAFCGPVGAEVSNFRKKAYPPGVPIDGPRGVPVEGPKPEPIDGSQVDERSERWTK